MTPYLWINNTITPLVSNIFVPSLYHGERLGTRTPSLLVNSQLLHRWASLSGGIDIDTSMSDIIVNKLKK